MTKFVWVFKRLNVSVPNAAFSCLDKAEKWIFDKKSTGVLTKMPLDISIFEWTEENRGVPEHFHYEDGKKVA